MNLFDRYYNSPMSVCCADGCEEKAVVSGGFCPGHNQAQDARASEYAEDESDA